MINPNKTNEYLTAIGVGFDYYGLNGFYEMHKDVCEKPDNPWAYALSVLNDLNYEEFESLCTTYLKNNRTTT
jgi:hypothetical protein